MSPCSVYTTDATFDEVVVGRDNGRSDRGDPAELAYDCYQSHARHPTLALASQNSSGARRGEQQLLGF